MSNESCLSDEHRQILSAALARILPSASAPGAIEAGVPGYVEGGLSAASAGMRAHVESGLDFLAALAEERFARGFAICDAAQQDAVLEELAAEPQGQPRQFLQLLVMMAIEGFLCDPARGGNREGLGWQAVGYQPTEVAGARDDAETRDDADASEVGRCLRS